MMAVYAQRRCTAFSFPTLRMKKPDDSTSLGILLQVMKERWAAGDKDGAVELARETAPYFNPCQTAPRKSRAAEKPTLEPHRLSDAELEQLIREFSANR